MGSASTIQNDRSFVGRGDSVGVFKTVDDELQYVATLKNLRLKDGKAFSPAKVAQSLSYGNDAVVCR